MPSTGRLRFSFARMPKDRTETTLGFLQADRAPIESCVDAGEAPSRRTCDGPLST
jgi:hypothetical protein